ncbi:acetoin utilization AcuB family protein [Guptibacillus algicola]|uniref:acetoin utilization AcuB family protein n=1 Tax=Guptibacillus algicola TaxID=225844 RepID=UPI001CD63CBC|nr:acetoin utilization AcuB family protein [Alkalihalobacillus algicola]MCA0986382.1 acetoin utilization AcuB family protein [Alkalihalobacillus algicola]
MIIEEIMNRNVFSLNESQTIADAIKLMREKNIRHLPIVNNDGELVGIVSDRDVKEASPSILDANPNREVLESSLSSIMKKDVITAHPLDFVEEISNVFYEHRISCIPIIDNRKVIGIVTETDMLHTLILLTGAHQPSSHIEVQVENVSGKLADITQIIRKRNVNIISVLVYPCSHNEGYKNIVFRVQTMNPTAVVNDITEEGYNVLWPSMPGVQR